MRKYIVALAVAAPLALLSGVASAKGCLKGAAVESVTREQLREKGCR
jgi:hypothetical protein